nr:unnamed protein product [Callosobruchus chinensis]
MYISIAPSTTRMSRGIKILQILNIPAPDAQNTSTRQRDFGMETAVFNEAINNAILFMEEQDMIEDNTSTAHKICDRHEENAEYSSISREDILPDLMNVKNCDNMDKTETTSKSYIQPEQDVCECNSSMHENEVLDCNISSHPGGIESEDEENQLIRKKRKIPNSRRDVNYKQNKLLRQQGLSYEGRKKSDGKWNYSIPRPGKLLSTSRNCKLSSKKTALECRKLTEEDRRMPFSAFWEKSWPEKRECVSGLARLQSVKRRRLFRVCRKIFNSTLGLKENCVLLWFRDNDINNPGGEQLSEVRESNDKRTRTRISEDIGKKLKTFFDSLPKMDSHYCRASTRRLYLEPKWQKQDLYRFYVQQHCAGEQITPVSRTGYTQMEADSMHSTIERRIRNKDINLPADKVQYLDHSFFCIRHYTSIRPGRKILKKSLDVDYHAYYDNIPYC